ncbi:MAG: alpha/beta hydrolase fold domain-containing protein [Caldilineaceae bacterium]
MTTRQKWTLSALMVTLALTLLGGARLAFASPRLQTTGANLTTYQVTLTNLTTGQPFSRAVAVVHGSGARLFATDTTASDALAALAQSGNPTPLFTLLSSGVPSVTEALIVDQPVAASGTPSSTVAFTVTAAPGDFLSLAAMLLCTNDGFVGLDSAALPAPGQQRVIALGAYDAGRELNSESSADLPDECSTLGPIALAGDPNGNINDGTVVITPTGVITTHPGVTGGGDLTIGRHSLAQIATVTITSLGTPVTGTTTATSTLSGTTALTPTATATTVATPIQVATPTTSTTGRTPVTATEPITTTGPLTATSPLTVTGTPTETTAISPSTTITSISAITAGTIGVPIDLMAGTLPTATLGLMGAIAQEVPITEMQAVLDAFASFGLPLIAEQSARNARTFPTAGDAVVALLASRGESTAPQPVGAISHRVIPSSAPDGTVLRILTPGGAGPFPVVVYYHGGGWVIAGLDAYEASARALVNAANCIVVMVDYRQSPEARFPAALNDSYDAFQWVVANAADLNGDPTRVAVAGESVGGNLATEVALLARDRGTTPPVYQLLIYPVTQLVSTNTPSYVAYADAAPLNQAMMPWFATRYLADPAAASDPYASPLLVDDLSGLPPATLITAGIDPLQSEGAAYAARLQEAGVPVVYQNFAGVTHEFFGMGAVLPEAQDAVALAADGLQSAFATETTPITNTTTPTATNAVTATQPLTNTGAITSTGTVTQ